MDMSNQPETPEEIQEEMKELGIDNDASGKPDLFISGPALKVGAGILVVVLIAGMLTLLY